MWLLVYHHLIPFGLGLTESLLNKTATKILSYCCNFTLFSSFLDAKKKKQQQQQQRPKARLLESFSNILAKTDLEKSY